MKKQEQKREIKALEKRYEKIFNSGMGFEADRAGREGRLEVAAAKKLKEAIELLKEAHEMERLY